MEPVLEQKKIVVRDKLRLWQNTYYSATLDAKIGGDIDDPHMIQRAKDQMKQGLRAIAVLEEVLTELEATTSDTEQGGNHGNHDRLN